MFFWGEEGRDAHARVFSHRARHDGVYLRIKRTLPEHHDGQVRQLDAVDHRAKPGVFDRLYPDHFLIRDLFEARNFIRHFSAVGVLEKKSPKKRQAGRFNQPTTLLNANHSARVAPSGTRELCESGKRPLAG